MIPGSNSDKPELRAVAYYRYSAPHRQTEALAVQRDHVRAWAESRGMLVVREFIDAGAAAGSPDERPSFADLLAHCRQRRDFVYILCHDATRWGRRHDEALAAQARIERHGKQLIFTTTESFHPGAGR